MKHVTREENICQVNHRQEDQQLQRLAEHELGQVPGDDVMVGR